MIGSIIGAIGNLFNSGGRSINDPLEAQKEYNQQMAWKAYHANVEKSENDHRSTKANNRMDSLNKMMNAMSEQIKKINF